MSALENVQQALVHMAHRACFDRRCGIPNPMAGAKHRPDRCTRCPLEDVDAVWDDYAASGPAPQESEP